MTANDPTAEFSLKPANSNEEVFVTTAQSDGQLNWARRCDHAGETIFDLDLRPIHNLKVDTPEKCIQCQSALKPWLDRISIRRKCINCEKWHYAASTDPTQGPFVKKDEDLVIPSAIINANMNLTHGASFTRRGVDWLAKELFPRPIGLLPNNEQMQAGLLALVAEAGNILDSSPLLVGLDRHSEEGFSLAMKKLMENPQDPGMAALLVETKAQSVEELLREASNEDLLSVAVATWSAASAAAIMRFKISFEEAAFRGHSLERIRWLISQWSENKNNSSEQFWQNLLLDNPFALSQLFAVPVVIHGDRYMLGGIRAGGKHGKLADYLLRNQLTDAAIIVEIKTPCTPLLQDTEYRQDVFVPSRDLSGAVQQVLEQRSQFMKNMNALQSEQEVGIPRVEVVEPHCVVIVGNAADIKTRAQRRSFEAYRTELRNIRVVTFDELFAKLNGLAGLLNVAADE